MSATRMICRFLVVVVSTLPFQTVRAGMIGTDQVDSARTANADRTAIRTLINRAEVAGRLQAMGVDPKTADERVAAMTDEESRVIAGNLDSLPAGASANSWTWAIVIAVAAYIYYAYHW